MARLRIAAYARKPACPVPSESGVLRPQFATVGNLGCACSAQPQCMVFQRTTRRMAEAGTYTLPQGGRRRSCKLSRVPYCSVWQFHWRTDAWRNRPQCPASTRVMGALFTLFAAIALGAADQTATPPADPGADSARDIIRRSTVLDERNFRAAREYTFTERTVERKLDAAGRERSVSSKTYEITFLFGLPYRRLVARDGRPLPAEEAREEEKKLGRAFSASQRQSQTERQRRASEYEKRRERTWAFLREVPDAFDFRLLGEEMLHGRPAYVIEAAPKPGYRPRNSEARLFTKLRGKLWIDKAELQWVKGEAETTDTIAFGVFLARLAPGSRLEFEQAKVNDEVWLPHRISYAGSGRVALVRTVHAGGEILYGNYRKFQSDFEITIPAGHSALGAPGASAPSSNQ